MARNCRQRMNFMPAVSSTDSFGLAATVNTAILVGIVFALRELMYRRLTVRITPESGHLGAAQ